MSDLIIRQAAIKICNSAIGLWEEQLGFGQLGFGALVAVRDNIADLPSAESERKGNWIYATNAPSGESCYVCSECGVKLDSRYTSYCGNCGSKMER